MTALGETGTGSTGLTRTTRHNLDNEPGVSGMPAEAPLIEVSNLDNAPGASGMPAEAPLIVVNNTDDAASASGMTAEVPLVAANHNFESTEAQGGESTEAAESALRPPPANDGIRKVIKIVKKVPKHGTGQAPSLQADNAEGAADVQSHQGQPASADYMKRCVQSPAGSLAPVGVATTNAKAAPPASFPDSPNTKLAPQLGWDDRIYKGLLELAYSISKQQRKHEGSIEQLIQAQETRLLQAVEKLIFQQNQQILDQLQCQPVWGDFGGEFSLALNSPDASVGNKSLVEKKAMSEKTERTPPQSAVQSVKFAEEPAVYTDTKTDEDEAEEALEDAAPRAVNRCDSEDKNIKSQLEKTRNTAKSGVKAMRRTLSGPVQPFVGCAQSVLKWRGFEGFSAGVIVVNAILVGVEADYIVTSGSSSVPVALGVLDWTCNIIFTLELILRMMASGQFFFSLRNKNLCWNWFDLIVVSTSYITEILALFTSQSMDLSVLRLLRIFRLVRVFRVLRVLRFFSVLRTMIAGILISFKSLMWALLLLSIIMYVFGVCVLQIVGTALEDEKDPLVGETRDEILSHYENLMQATYTLFKAISGGIDWGDAADPLMRISSFMGLLFALYIAFVVFCMLNIMTGIFVENANQLMTKDEDSMMMEHAEERKRWTEAVRQLFCRFGDNNEEHAVDFDHFSAKLDDEHVQTYLGYLGVEFGGVSKRALFNTLDVDGDGQLDPEEFTTALQNLHGPARAVDLYMLKKSQKQILDCSEDVKRQLSEISVTTRKLQVRASASRGQLRGIRNSTASGSSRNSSSSPDKYGRDPSEKRFTSKVSTLRVPEIGAGRERVQCIVTDKV
jgi:hypothetical protein